MAIGLWLWSSWVIAAGCCCEPTEAAAAGATPQSLHGNAADDHGHEHGHHPARATHGGLDPAHSQDNAPAEDCVQIEAPDHGLLPKEAVPPSLLALDHPAVPPAEFGDVLASWSEWRRDRAPPSPGYSPGDPFLETVRLLL
jgi:hypothetical protein